MGKCSCHWKCIVQDKIIHNSEDCVDLLFSSKAEMDFRQTQWMTAAQTLPKKTCLLHLHQKHPNVIL